MIKKELGVGNIYIKKEKNMAQFKIRNLKVLKEIIFPIFDKYPLLTSKYFNYFKFKKAHSILSNPLLKLSEKNRLLMDLTNLLVPNDYCSPIWSIINNEIRNYDYAIKVMSKSWLVGFIEAEGSFYLVNKSGKNGQIRLVHGFEINQKKDKIVLIGIKYLLNINTEVQVKNSDYFSLSTTKTNNIRYLISYFQYTMKGIKSLEFRIWAWSFNKFKGKHLELEIIRNRVRKMRMRYKGLENVK